MTWSHPRGYDPMVATAAAWRERTGVEIVWQKRSLQDFESFPVENLARQYDFIVIDHPHVGQITAQHCLVPFTRAADLAALAAGSVGQSFESYRWEGQQWALPIDAAAQIMAYRPDLIDEVPRKWEEVVALAMRGLVILPMLPPHNLMCLFTLAANLGAPCATQRDTPFLAPDAGREVIEPLLEITALIDLADFAMDPIAASEAMARENAAVALMPLGYGYVSYARPGFRAHALTFADVPLSAHRGSALGGTGIAVSAFSAHAEAATDYAYWVASAEVQRGVYASAGGQPGHATAWEDSAVNADAGNFYRDTRATLEASYVRPRHAGYMAFQQAAALRLNAGLLARETPATIIAALNTLFERSF